MKILILIFLLPIVILGCASYSQLFISPQGEIMRCGAYGSGIIGIASASKIQGDCKESMRAAGYLELERAGVIGIFFSEPLLTDTLFSVLKVAPNSPAAEANIRGGDIFISVDNQKVRKPADAKILLFGIAGTPVAVTLLRGTELHTYNLIRAPYTRIFGTPDKAK